MYVVRRGDRWWFRKAVPVDLVDVLGMAEVRRSLRTGNAREARRRALEVLVKVEDVYAVLRSKRPLRPARDVALSLLEQALDANFGSPVAFERKDRLLRDAASVLRRTGDGDLSVGSRSDLSDLIGLPGREEAYVDEVATADDALHVLRGERPAGEENRIAVAILEAVARMGRGELKDTAAGVRELDDEGWVPRLAQRRVSVFFWPTRASSQNQTSSGLPPTACAISARRSGKSF